ncbi:hypothetical protein HY251_16860 [bacterium]|nr:hypothetical protein [bacterium]
MDDTARIEVAAERLRHAERLLIMTGAGMSVDSGVPAYRAPGTTGWQNYGFLEAIGLKAEDLACPKAFEDDPATAWGFLEWKRRLMAANEPHAGYAALHALGRIARESFVQTANVDGYHLRAGWPAERLHEIHGSFWRLQCSGPCARRSWEDMRVPLSELDPKTMRLAEWPRCSECGRTARPHAILFADLDYVGNLPAEEARRRFHASGPDVAIIVGESGVIPTHTHDAATLRRSHGTFVIDLNPDPEARPARMADVHITLGAKEGLCRLLESVERLTR